MAASSKMYLLERFSLRSFFFSARRLATSAALLRHEPQRCFGALTRDVHCHCDVETRPYSPLLRSAVIALRSLRAYEDYEPTELASCSISCGGKARW